MATSHHAAGLKMAPIGSRGQIGDFLKTQAEIQTGIAEQMGLMWTVVVGECVNVGGVCVSRADSGQCMGNTAS